MPRKTAPAEQFGEAFFRRFYLNPKTRVVTSKEMIRRADLIAAFVNHGELQVRSILDVGCGLGLMRDQLLRHFPKAKYTGLEVSQYLCEKHGWIQGDWLGGYFRGVPALRPRRLLRRLSVPAGASRGCRSAEPRAPVPGRPALWRVDARGLGALLRQATHGQERPHPSCRVVPQAARTLVHQCRVGHVRAPRRASALVGARPGRGAAIAAWL